MPFMTWWFGRNGSTDRILLLLSLVARVPLGSLHKLFLLPRQLLETPHSIPRIMRLDGFAQSSRKGESYATKSDQSRSRHSVDLVWRLAGDQSPGPGGAELAGRQFHLADVDHWCRADHIPDRLTHRLAGHGCPGFDRGRDRRHPVLSESNGGI